MKVETISDIRNADVINAFFDSVKSLRNSLHYIPQDKVIEHALNQGAPRFYTTFENARRFVSLLERGKELPLKNENKISMYKEIYKLYKQAKESEGIEKGYAVLERIIEMPASSFFIDIDTFRGILYKKHKRR